MRDCTGKDKCDRLGLFVILVQTCEISIKVSNDPKFCKDICCGGEHICSKFRRAFKSMSLSQYLIKH